MIWLKKFEEVLPINQSTGKNLCSDHIEESFFFLSILSGNMEKNFKYNWNSPVYLRPIRIKGCIFNQCYNPKTDPGIGLDFHLTRAWVVISREHSKSKNFMKCKQFLKSFASLPSFIVFIVSSLYPLIPSPPFTLFDTRVLWWFVSGLNPKGRYTEKIVC